jgi:hypothetical protein
MFGNIYLFALRMILLVGFCAAEVAVAQQTDILPRAADARVRVTFAPDQPAPTEPQADWRYRFDNGRWWYWLPSNQWALWNGSNWTTTYRTVSYQGPNRHWWPGGVSGAGYFKPGWYGAGYGPFGGAGAYPNGNSAAPTRIVELPPATVVR